MWSIWSVGDFKFLAAVLNSVAAWAGTGQPKQVAAIGMLLSFLVLGFQGMQKGAQMPQFQNILIGWIVFAFLFGPGVTVVVKDSYSVKVEVVDNVPIGMAAAGSILSNIAHELTASMEQTFTLPTMTEDGFGSTLSLLLKQRQNDLGPANHTDSGGGVISGDLAETLSNYIKDCTMVGVQRGEKKEADILNNPDHLASIFWGSDVYYTKTLLPISVTEGEGVVRTCNDAYNEITKHMNSAAFWGKWEDYLDTFLGANSVSRTQLALDAIVGSGKDAHNYMLASLYRDVYERAMRQTQVDTNDIAGTIVTTSAREQRNVQWAAESSLFMSVAKPMMTFFEAFIYAVTPFMAFLVVLVPIGLSLAAKYCMTAIWVQLWMPVMAILNFYINFIAQKRISTLDAQVDITSISGMVAANTQLADWMATAGMLAASVPIITMSLVAGGAVSATALAQRMTGRDHVDEKSLAPPLMSQGAAVGLSHGQWDKTSGLRATGAEGAMPNISFGDDLQKTTASSQTKMAQSTSALEQAIGQSLAGSNNWSESGGITTQGMQSLTSSGTKTTDWARQTAAAIKKTLGDDKINSDALTGALIAGAGAGLGGNKSAIKANMAGSLESTFGRTTSNKIMSALEESGLFKAGSSARADLVTAMGHDVTNMHGTQFANSESETNKKDLTEKIAAAESDSKEFKQNEALASHYGANTSMPLNTMAERAVANGALPGLDNAVAGIGADHPGIFEERDALANRYQALDMSPGTARAAADLSILDRYGKRTDDAGIKAREGLIDGIKKATGQDIKDTVGANPHKNVGVAPTAGDAGTQAAAAVNGANLGAGVPAPGSVPSKVSAGLTAAQKAANNIPMVIGHNSAQAAEVLKAGEAGLAAQKAEYLQHHREQVAQQVYNPSLANSHTNKSYGVLSGLLDDSTNAMGTALDMVKGGLKGAYNGAQEAYSQAKQKFDLAMAEGASPESMKEKMKSLREAENAMFKADAGVLKELFNDPGKALKGLGEAGINVGNKLYDALAHAANSPGTALSQLNALLDIPLATAAGAAGGAIHGTADAIRDRENSYLNSEKAVALNAGLSDEQAEMYALARADRMGRLSAAFGIEGGADMSSYAGALMGDNYGYGVNLQGENADLKRDGIMMAAHAGDTNLLAQIGKLNELDGTSQDGTPQFGFMSGRTGQYSASGNPELLKQPEKKPPTLSPY